MNQKTNLITFNENPFLKKRHLWFTHKNNGYTTCGLVIKYMHAFQFPNKIEISKYSTTWNLLLAHERLYMCTIILEYSCKPPLIHSTKICIAEHY